MQIPIGDSGFPTVSATQLRTYGAGGFRLNEQEEPRGCPRQYKAKYVERRVTDAMEKDSDPLRYGRMFHEAMYLIETEEITPDEAADRVFPADMDPVFWTELKNDLTRYMEREASPADEGATLGAELDLSCELFVDAEFGPVWYRVILDLIKLDPGDDRVIHVIDYKTNRQPPSTDDVLGDVQMRGYAWFIRKIAQEKWGIPNPIVIVHLDAVKFRDVVVHFSDESLAEWHDWACAVVRKILRDEVGAPVLNPDCVFCPVNGDCPAYAALPETASALAAQLTLFGDDDAAKLRWRDGANSVRLLLEKSVKAIDEAFKDEARRRGELVVGDQVFALDTDWTTETDLRQLHRVLGPRFYDVIVPQMTRLKALIPTLGTGELAGVKEAMQRVPVGQKVVRRKVDPDG